MLAWAQVAQRDRAELFSMEWGATLPDPRVQQQRPTHTGGPVGYQVCTTPCALHLSLGMTMLHYNGIPGCTVSHRCQV